MSKLKIIADDACAKYINISYKGIPLDSIITGIELDISDFVEKEMKEHTEEQKKAFEAIEKIRGELN